MHIHTQNNLSIQKKNDWDLRRDLKKLLELTRNYRKQLKKIGACSIRSGSRLEFLLMFRVVVVVVVFDESVL